MTIRENLSSVESVASLTALGRLADQAALGAHRARTGSMTDDDRAALARAREQLVQLQEFTGVALPRQASLRAMGPAAVLEETFGAVSRTGDQIDVGALVEGLINSIDAITAGNANRTQIDSVESFFSGLSASTLNRTISVARRGPERRLRWMNEALNSFEA